jgi:two-component system, LytTR family, response regulator
MYRCIAIDDEPLALNIIADYIRKTPSLQLVDISTSPRAALQRVLNGEADLLFLDIEMPGLNGIEFMQLAGNHSRFILTTAYPDYALKGYEYNVVDYLLKPIAYDRFLKAVQKLPALINGPEIKPAAFFFVKSEYKLVRIDYEEVICLEALRDYVAIHTVTGQKILTLQSLSSFSKELPEQLFTRIHKSYIVAINKINSLTKNKIIAGTHELPVGETYKGNLMKVIRM